MVNYRAGDQTGLCAEADVLYMDGRLAWGRKTALDVQEDQTVTCFPMDEPEDITDVYFLRLRLTRADGTLLSNNFYALGREEGNLRALRSMPKARVKLERVKAQACCRDASDDTCRREGGCCGGTAGSCGGDEIVEIVRLTNVGKTPALMLRLKALDSATGDLILPVWYSDNYVSLMPGESVELRVKVRREDLRGRLRLEAEGCL